MDRPPGSPWAAGGPDGDWWHREPTHLEPEPTDDEPPHHEPEPTYHEAEPTYHEAEPTDNEPRHHEPEPTDDEPPHHEPGPTDYEPEPTADTRPVPAPAQAVDDEPFWLPAEEVSRNEPEAAWPAPRMRAGRHGSLHRSSPPADRRTRPRSPRRAGPALSALVLLSLLAAFFGWVSAEPLWLAVGHGNSGTATVSRCNGSGVAQRCVGRFAEAEGRFVADRVALLGITGDQRHAGAVVRARMVGSESRQAYVGTDGLGLHLRWGLGLALVMLCGAGIAWATGAARLENPLARRRVVLASLAGPLLLAVGFIAAAW